MNEYIDCEYINYEYINAHAARLLIHNVEDCRTCRHYKKLTKYNYINSDIGQSCELSDEDGFACLCFINEGTVIHMVNSGYCPCEEYEIKYDDIGSEIIDLSKSG